MNLILYLIFVRFTCPRKSNDCPEKFEYSLRVGGFPGEIRLILALGVLNTENLN